MFRSLIFGLSVIAATAVQAAAPPTLIRDVAVFDGNQRFAKRNVLLADGKIADPDFRGKTPAGARVVDGAGKTLLPGLIDAHVHAFQGQDDPLLFGVTTQLDMFAPVAATATVRDRMKAGTNAGAADIFTAGILATVPGGHGTEYGLVIPTLTKPEEAEAWVVARIAEGSDYIKIIDEPRHREAPDADARHADDPRPRRGGAQARQARGRARAEPRVGDARCRGRGRRPRPPVHRQGRRRGFRAAGKGAQHLRRADLYRVRGVPAAARAVPPSSTARRSRGCCPSPRSIC